MEGWSFNQMQYCVTTPRLAAACLRYHAVMVRSNEGKVYCALYW